MLTKNDVTHKAAELLEDKERALLLKSGNYPAVW